MVNELIKNDEYIVEKQKAVILTDEITELKQSLGKNVWELGTRLKMVRESKLYECLGCSSWVEYCEKRIEMSKRMADYLIRAVSEFDEKLISQWGIYKLNLLLTIEPAAREAVIQRIKPNLPFSKLKREVDEEKEKVAPELPNELYSDFWNYEHDCEKALLLLEQLIGALNDLKYRYECICKNIHFKEYPRSKRIIEITQSVRKKVGELG